MAIVASYTSPHREVHARAVKCNGAARRGEAGWQPLTPLYPLSFTPIQAFFCRPVTIDRRRQYHFRKFQPMSFGDEEATKIDLIRDTLFISVSMDLSVEGDEVFAHFWAFLL